MSLDDTIIQEDDYYRPYAEEHFEVDKILDARMNPRTNKQEYLVEWKKWPDDNTWEPVSNLKEYMSFVQKYLDEKRYKKLQAAKLAQTSQTQRKPEKRQVESSKQEESKGYETRRRLRSQNGVSEGKVEAEKQQQQQKKVKKSTIDSYLDGDDEDEMSSDVDGEYDPEVERTALSQEIESMVAGISSSSSHFIEEEEQKIPKNLEEELERFKRDFALNYPVPSQSGLMSLMNGSAFVDDEIQMLEEDNNALLGAVPKKHANYQTTSSSTSVRRTAKRSKPKVQQEFGDFLVDDIADVVATITYEYHITWKHKAHLIEQPEPQQIMFTKVKQITPDQFISELSEHYTENVSNQEEEYEQHDGYDDEEAQ